MLTLGLIARNEEEMLRRTLPVVAPFFKDTVYLDTGSTDGTVALLQDYDDNGWVTNFKWQNDFSAARNRILDITGPGPGWLLQLDADEAMFPCDLLALERLCATVTEDVIALPRINLAHCATLACTDNAPDHQSRCVRLGSSVRWELPVHEVIKAPTYFIAASGPTIYHYGFCKPPRSCWLRSHNYRMIAEGGQPLTEAPSWVSDDPDKWLADMRERHTFVPFTGMHPLRGLI